MGNLRTGQMNRREAATLIAAVAGALAIGVNADAAHQNEKAPIVKMTCFFRYQIDPFQKEAFKSYAEAWGRIIPRCGGDLVGYFLPWEGSNDVAWGLIAFDSLAAYETYRSRLKADPEARANFTMAMEMHLILREERSFVEVVDGTFGMSAPAAAA